MMRESLTTCRYTGFGLSLRTWLGGFWLWGQKHTECTVQRAWSPIADGRSGLKPSIPGDALEEPSPARAGDVGPQARFAEEDVSKSTTASVQQRSANADGA